MYPLYKIERGEQCGTVKQFVFVRNPNTVPSLLNWVRKTVFEKQNASNTTASDHAG
jgi:hypothetical protein